MNKTIIWKDIKSLAKSLEISIEGLYYWKNNKRKYVKYEKRISKNKTRDFYKPQGDYKILLKKIDKQLKLFKLPKYFYGSPKGVSAIDCARVHLYSPFILKLDLKSFFPNTHYSKVRKALQLTTNDSDVVSLLTNLCTFKHHIPQGFPTSPSLAEMTLLPLTDRLFPLCKQYGLNLSIYIDDICLSGSKILCDLQQKIMLIIKQSGLKINFEKKIFSSNTDGIVITGVLIQNKYATTTLEFDEELDALLCIFYNIDSDQCLDRDLFKLAQKIGGKFNYLKQVDSNKEKKIISRINTSTPPNRWV